MMKGFFWRPLLSLMLAVFLWISFLYLQRDLFSYSLDAFGPQFFTSTLLQIQLISLIWVFLLGLIVDFVGARIGLMAFFVGALLFTGLTLIKSHSAYGIQLALQFSVMSQILLVLVVLKSLAIYSKGIKFLVSLALLYTIFSVLVHFASPTFFPHLALPSFYRLAEVLCGASVVLGGGVYFLFPSLKQEKTQYDLEKFRHILRPIYSLKAWPVMLSLGVLLFFSIVFFKLAVLYCFPVLLSIDDGYDEAVFLFGLGMIVGFFIYSVIFKSTPYLGRMVGASLALAILCLLGIGFLSMSEELVWCLVALVGVFLGSMVLLFRLLQDVVGVQGFATACSISVLLGGASYAILGMTVFKQVHHLPAAHAMHAFYVHVWWVGVFLLVIAAICAFLVQNIKLSLPVLKGLHARLFPVLKQYFRGGESLPSTFWLLSVVGRWIVVCTLFWILFFFWLPSNTVHLMALKTPPMGEVASLEAIDWYHLSKFGLILTISGIVMSLYLMISVWRSGYGKSIWIWRYFSRLIVVMVFLRNIILLLGVSAGIYLHFHPEVAAGYLHRFAAGTTQSHS